MNDKKESLKNRENLRRKYWEDREKYLEELKADKERLINEFAKFSGKYEEKIWGFTMIRRNGRYILMDILVSGDRAETMPITKLPFVSKKE
jgi:hypothetical protein